MTDTAAANDAALQRYYQLHSKIYDLTRWSFLFGRNRILKLIAETCPCPKRILEVGCGTGKNLVPLARRFPEAELVGVDLAGPMLAVARKKLSRHNDRVTLLEQPYDAPVGGEAGFDIVLFSYCLTMINPGWDGAIQTAANDLAPGGKIAVVDFHDTAFGAFRGWMKLNHVRMQAHLLGKLDELFQRDRCEIRRAYGCVWRYLLYVGQPRPA